MNRFVHEQNLRHLREVLARTTDEGERRLIVELTDRTGRGMADGAERQSSRANPQLMARCCGSNWQRQP